MVEGMAEEKRLEKTRMIAVQVCLATADRQILRDLAVAEGTTLIEAIRLSGIEAEINCAAQQGNPAHLRAGIYGKQKAPDTVLRDGDRVEIYRPLRADPKEARRRRVKKSEMKGSGGSVSGAGGSA